MKEVEFYSKAQTDASFRQHQLQEAASTEQQIRIGFWVMLTAILGYVAFCLIFQRRMPDIGPSVLSLVLCAWGLGQSRTKRAALQAINQVDKGSHPTLP